MPQCVPMVDPRNRLLDDNSCARSAGRGRNRGAWLEPTQADKLCASLEPTRSIHLQKRDRRPSGGGQSYELAPAQHEMHRPDVPSWMEQRGDFARAGIDSGEIGSLVAVTSMARPPEVVEVRLATMLAGDDMLQMERLERR